MFKKQRRVSKTQKPERLVAKYPQVYGSDLIGEIHDFGIPWRHAAVLITGAMQGFVLVRPRKVQKVDGNGNLYWEESPNCKWRLPGGRCQVWEHFQDSAMRLAKSETGYDVHLESICFMGDSADIDDNYHLVIYRASIVGEPGPYNQNDIAEVHIFSADDILELERRDELEDAYVVWDAINNHLANRVIPCHSIVSLPSKYSV